jgi:non-specific serine/threonine protein kinase
VFDLRGALVRGPEPEGFYQIERGGFVHPEYLELVPGVGRWDYGRSWRVPENLLPARAVRPPDVPCCPRSGLVLRGYQIEAVRFAFAAGGCCVIAHDVGLGKSLVALMIHWLGDFVARTPFLVVGPLIAAGAWVGEEADPATHFGYKVVALRSRDPQAFTEKYLDELRAADGYFINFEILADWQTQLSGYGFRTVIVDESHLLRSGRTDGARAFRALTRARSVRTRVALTATPIVNKVADLWSQLDFAQPDAYGKWTDFVLRYNGAHPTEYTRYALGDETNVEELRQRLVRTLLRRSRFDARKELPAFERQLAPLNQADLDKRLVSHYRDLEESFRDAAANIDSLSGLALQQVTAMAGVLAEAKRPFAAAEAEGLARAAGAVVVFTWYKETASFVAAALRDINIETYGPIDSDTTKPKRDKAAEAFKRSAIAAHAPVAFVATIGCAGMSMNQLAAAPCALCCELYWVPATLLQMEGRIHREGQRAANCFVRYLYVRGTIDELMLRHLQRKARAIERVADDAEALSLCEALGGPEATAKRDFSTLVEALLAHTDDGTGENE